MEYRVDARDIHFQLFDWLAIDDLLADERFSDWDRESIEMSLAEGQRIATEELAPANVDGDRLGARLEDGKVTLPPSFLGAYKTVAEGGWVGSTNRAEFGGLGLPHTVGSAINEMFAGANLSLTLVFLLTRGVGHLIERHGSEELKALYCERLYQGADTGTMCLTEPHAGSDVGASTSRAEPLGNGRYRISGEKIFITFGEHDLTANIVHAVLARLPDAPSGTHGLSLFIAPKLRPRANGGGNEPNDVVCASLEHKLGIHGSPTCSVLFGAHADCEAWLLGEPHEGMKLMFEMMNEARLEVGLQGLAVAAAAHQAALAYARERVQGRHWAARERDADPVAIVEHPDVRRLLLTCDAFVQAMRALLLKTSVCIDRAAVSTGEEAARWASCVEVLTPICKAWASDWGFRVTEWSLQVFGGYGYTRDYPAEQYLRDAKITSIYEGTNGIQALDLVFRKMRRERQAVEDLMAEAGRTAAALAADPQLGSSAALLGTALAEFQEVTAATLGRDDAPLLLGLNAVPLLDMMGHLLGGSYLLDQARIASQRLTELAAGKGVDAANRDAWAELLADDARAAFLHNKVQTAIHFAHRVVPQVQALAVPLAAGERAAIDAIL